MNTDCNNKDRLPSNGIPFTDEEPDEEGVSVYEHHRLTADSGQKPMRIDKFLMEHLYNTSRNRLPTGSRAGVHPRKRTAGEKQL